MIDLQREVNTRTTHELLARKEHIQKSLKVMQSQVNNTEAEAPFDEPVERSKTSMNFKSQAVLNRFDSKPTRSNQEVSVRIYND